MRLYKKHLLIITSFLCFVGCNRPIENKIEVTVAGIASMPLANRIVCNEFNVAYYEFKTTHNHFVYSPVYKHWTSGDVTVMTCTEYEAYTNSGKNE